MPENKGSWWLGLPYRVVAIVQGVRITVTRRGRVNYYRLHIGLGGYVNDYPSISLLRSNVFKGVGMLTVKSEYFFGIFF